MKTKRFLLLIIAVTTLASCTTTRYGMTRSTLDNTMASVKEDYRAKGYYLTSEHMGQSISTQISNTRDARNSVYMADNANAKIDEYSFQDTIGNTLKFAITYNEALQGNTMYLLDVSTIGCEVSNPMNYESLCGKDSPIEKIRLIPQDKPVEVGDAAKTQKLVVYGAYGALAVAIIWVVSIFI